MLMKKILVTFISAIFLVCWFSYAGNYTTEQQEAYNYAYGQGITTISPIEKANMNGKLTRIAMAKMISNFAINVLWLQPDTSKDCSFLDISDSLNAQYNYGVTQVCQLWLMWIWNDWKKSDKFNPYTTVTRAQFATALSRALGQANWKIIDNWNPYYSTHLEYLHSNWIIKDVVKPSPSSVEKRWDVMIMMHRVSNEIKNIENKNDINWNFEYYYKDLDIIINIWLDWKADILEKFTTYFNVEKHWIIRSIPLTNISISDINVKWQKFITYTEDWNINIKIWDADKLIKWIQTYPISYKVDWLIRNYPSWFSELYWNLVGNDFDTNINKVRAEIILPKAYDWLIKNYFIVTTNWLTNAVGDFEWSIDWSQWDKIIIEHDKWLQAYEWLTLSVKFPSDYFEFGSNSDSSKLGYRTQDEWNESDVASSSNYIELEKVKATQATDLKIKINNKSEWNIRIIGIKLWNYKTDNSANVYFGDNTMDDILKDWDDTATINFPYPIDIKVGDSHTLTVRANIVWTNVTLNSVSFEIEEDDFWKDYEVTKNNASVADWENLFAQK